MSSPLDLLLFLPRDPGTNPSLLGLANRCSGGGISAVRLSYTTTVVLPLYNEYFVMLKESWMFDIVQLLKIMLRFIVFSLYLRVFILSFKTCSKQEAILSSGIVWPDNFFPPFLNIELRQKKKEMPFWI